MFCILAVSGQDSIQEWPLFIQTTKAVHSLCHLPHFQIPLLQRSQRLPVLVSTRATIINHSKSAHTHIFRELAYSVFCKHSQVPGAAEELPDDRVRGTGEGILSQISPGANPTTWTAASGELH